MASQRMLRREKKRRRLVNNRQEMRTDLRAQLKNPALSLEEKFAIQGQLERLPRDSSSVRLTRRCARTGRAHGVYRKFGLCRNELRRLAAQGYMPGLVKASW